VPRTALSILQQAVGRIDYRWMSPDRSPTGAGICREPSCRHKCQRLAPGSGSKY
jgi:hypothetical protein